MPAHIYHAHDMPRSPASLHEKLSVEVEKLHALHDHEQHYVVPDPDYDDWDDPNIDSDVVSLDDDSPYPEVRSAVANTDDPDMPVSTLRAWVIGLVWAIILPGINQFLFFRYPSIVVTGITAQLLSYPLGRLWAYIVPGYRIFGVSLNPGPFSMKEHVLITIMANVGYVSAYATDIVAVQRVFYGEVYSFGYQWMLVTSTQLIGFSIGGVARRFLVAPPSMIWPANLVTCALFNTLHSQQYAGIGSRGGITREWFFLYSFAASFLWYFFPGYLFQALSYFNWVCWIAPKNVVVNQLFGYYTGLGMSAVTLDWSQIAYIGSPLATPWWASANVAVGFVLFFWLLCPILYYTNTWYAAFIPMSTRSSYDNTGGTYDVTRILTPDHTLDIDKYKAYSPLFLSMTFAMSYGLSFAAIAATIVHTIVYFRKQIWIQSRRSLSEQPDIHARLMSRYPQVPDWWYSGIFVLMFIFGVIVIEVQETQMPVWALVLALMISFIYTIPVGMIQAITNQQIGLNVITELIVGYALPGKPIAMMLFKTWGYNTMAQALQFTSDFKLGHYMKIPPRAMFFSQVVAAVVAGTVQLGVQSWMFSNIPDMCHPRQPDGFICPSTEVFGTASIVWGVIGPQRQFSPGQIYHSLTYFFLIGALCPVAAYTASLWWPHSFLRYVNFPVIFNGTSYIPPASAVNYVPWTIVGFVFNFFIRRRHFSWWTKYNYILSAGLDAGVAISILVVYFCLQYPAHGTLGTSTIGSWWGNTVMTNTADYGPVGSGVPLTAVAPGATFGPSSW
ncbi:OPT oligopeptide transporter [Epithele typhae]|uniref:OPT oligopeptide transporter n=1 Tax=Epithele typhae TaxID=378194 RepID=UPI002008186A|nr:OPT oligopeptide transporter [Epithele typhae]KAH9911356.1 OPT oligopeptide transporter [Epithele typhae]